MALLPGMGVFRWLALNAILLVATGSRLLISANPRGSLKAVNNPAYVVSGKDAYVTWDYYGDVPLKIMMGVRIKNTTESLDLWTITVSTAGNDNKLIEYVENAFLPQTNARTLSNRTTVEYRQDQFRLKIAEFTHADTIFAFVCVVEYDQFNSISQLIEIFVAAVPVITSSFGGTRAIPKGGIINLHCSATGSPAPQLAWRMSSQIRSSGISNVNLILENIQPEDTGTYTCNAVNQAGSTEKSVAVTVTYIEVDATYVRVREHEVGTTAEISCPVLGYPEPSYIWKMRDRVVGGQQTLLFNEVDAQDFAMYSCIASNSAGTLSTGIELARKGSGVGTPATRSTAHRASWRYEMLAVIGAGLILISLQ